VAAVQRRSLTPWQAINQSISQSTRLHLLPKSVSASTQSYDFMALHLRLRDNLSWSSYISWHLCIHCLTLLAYIIRLFCVTLIEWKHYVILYFSLRLYVLMFRIQNTSRQMLLLMGRDYVSELRPPTGPCFILQIIYMSMLSVEWYWLGKTEESHIDWPWRELMPPLWKAGD
jgi:hypothetical protein